MANFATNKIIPMKQLLKSLFIVVVLLSAVGCDSFRSLTGAKKTAQGSPYEVLVVCDGYEWESALGAELKAVLESPVEMLNQVEPMFNVVRITARDFKHLLPSYRNILQVKCSPEVKESAILAQYDVVASPQIVLTFQGPTIQAMVDYLNLNGKSLLQVLEMAERTRTIEYAKKQGAKAGVWFDLSLFKKVSDKPETGDILPFVTMLSAAAVGAAVTTWGLRRHAAQEEL
jgi:hypothetical protein